MVPDLINAMFELGGGVILIINVFTLYKDKMIKGIHPVPTTFFAFWGFWNLYYYSQLNQWFSVLGGVVIVTVNTIWLVMMFYYLKHPGGRQIRNDN